MEYTKHINGTNCEIILSGKFTFGDHATFREVIKDFSDKKITGLLIDCTNLEFIDSAGLGILLLLRDEADRDHFSLTIRNPGGQVQKMFKVAKFYELFHII